MIKQILSTEQRSTIERWCRERASAVQMPNGTTLCRVLGELPMVVTLDDLSVAPHLALDGYWELWNSMCLARHLLPGWNAIDVGANVGYFTLLMAKLTGGEVEAWEPSQVLCPLIEQSAMMNGLKQSVTVVRVAAGADHGKSTLVRAGRDYGSARVIDRTSIPGEEVSVWPLSQTSLNRVDFVKIDAEGKEEEIWEGMQRLVVSGELKAALIEWSPKKYRDPDAFLASIREHGFRVSVVDGGGGLQAPVGDITGIDGHIDLWIQR